ncbi:hypothetical protein AGMMS49938_16180 [Fibrobacterales bacterium]|nr:hypothetical protein AGMMS49938_16180 [Fibrobacterales bacterium]
MKKCSQDRDLMLSPMLRDALVQTLSKGEQAIILLNRRGYNSAVICEECGENLECVHCKVALVYHRQFGKLMCHYCGTMYKVGFCKCGSKNFIFARGGIEKAEEEIKEWLPAAQVLRLDSDTTGTIGATEKLLQRFRAQECNVLLGTQMVAKGHDFPNVSLVGVIGADIGSGIPDFRAGERSFQLLTQVAGRAGRLLENSQVIVQTFCPENPVIQFAVKHDFVGFAKWELEERKEAFYPPFGKIAQIKMQVQNEKKLVEGAEKLKEVLMKAGASVLNDLNAGGGGSDALSAGGAGAGGNALSAGAVQILGPVEPFVSKVQNQFRRHIMVKASSASALKNAIKTALSNPEFTPFAKAMEIRIDREA